MRTTNYRIRWARVSIYRRGEYMGKERMCIAENQHTFLWGLIRLWEPVANWRYSETAANGDATVHRLVHQPLPATKEVPR